MSRSNFGHIQRIAKDKYRIYWDDPPKPDGSRNQRSPTIVGTRDDAELALARARVGLYGVESSITYDEYWTTVVQPSFAGLAAKTVSGYERVWWVELSPRIGRIRVSKTTRRLVVSVIGDISAPSVQRAAHRVWKKVCNMAMAEDEPLLQVNPVDRNVRMKPQRKRKKGEVDAEAMMRYLAAVRGTRYEALVLQEIGGGLRHEEASAVCKADVARLEDRGRLYAAVDVNKALVTVDGRKLLKSTKNEPSERTAIIGEPFASSLLAIAEAAPGPALMPGRSPDGETTNETWFANPMHVSRNWSKWCDRNGIDYVRFGDMRTIYSDLHAEAGSLDSLVALSMGHSDGTTRGRNYQRNTRRGMQLIADSLTDYLVESAPCHELWDDGFMP